VEVKTIDQMLDAVELFIKENVVSGLKLKTPKGEYVEPNVFKGVLPFKHSLPDDKKELVPCILVGMGKGRDNDDDGDINIKLTIVTFDSGFNDGESEVQDMNGYTDLLIVIQRLRASLLGSVDVGGLGEVQRPYDFGMYEEQSYPFWYGYSMFGFEMDPIKPISSELENCL